MAICVKCEISLGNPRSNFPTQNPHPPRKRSSPPRPRKGQLRLYKRVRLFFASCAILSSPSSTFSLISSVAHLIQSSRNTTRPHARVADTNHTSTRHKSARQDKRPKVQVVLSGLLLLPPHFARTQPWVLSIADFTQFPNASLHTRTHAHAHSHSHITEGSCPSTKPNHGSVRATSPSSLS